MSWLQLLWDSHVLGLCLWQCLHYRSSLSEDELHPSGPGLLSWLLQFRLSLTSPGAASPGTFGPSKPELPTLPGGSAVSCAVLTCSGVCSVQAGPLQPSAAAGFAAQAVSTFPWNGAA